MWRGGNANKENEAYQANNGRKSEQDGGPEGGEWELVRGRWRGKQGGRRREHGGGQDVGERGALSSGSARGGEPGSNRRGSDGRAGASAGNWRGGNRGGRRGGERGGWSGGKQGGGGRKGRHNSTKHENIQLNKQIASCTSAETVFAALQQGRGRGVVPNAVNVSTAIHKLARHGKWEFGRALALKRCFLTRSVRPVTSTHGTLPTRCGRLQPWIW